MVADRIPPAADAQRARASITTPGGAWYLGWDPELATFWATHRRRSPDGTLSARPDHDLGTDVGACPSIGALEEALAFPLPAPVREALSTERLARPALARPRGALVVGDPERPRSLDTYPTWQSMVAVPPTGEPAAYGLRLEQERPVAVADLGGDTRLELLRGRPDAQRASQRVQYRLTHGERVLFAGNDIWAPADADLASLHAGRTVLALVLDPDAPQRTRPLSPVQAGFVEAHRDRLLAALEERPPEPDEIYHHPVGSRVAATVEGERVTGVVTYAACNKGQVLAYAWRPDVFSLVGHPWRHFEEHNWVSPPADLTRTLSPPFAADPPPGLPLAFGAVVALAHPETGERLEATVLRAFRDENFQFTYQVQPVADGVGGLVVGEQDCALVRGTWWPTRQDLVAARRQAGVDVVPGEVLAASEADVAVSLVGDGGVEPPQLTAAEQLAALTVDVGKAPPPMIQVSAHGQFTRVGDPHHGWLVVPTDGWEAAMHRPASELRDVVGRAAPAAVTGKEHQTVLAALAVHHVPDAFGAAASEHAGASVVPIRPSAGMGL